MGNLFDLFRRRTHHEGTEHTDDVRLNPEQVGRHEDDMEENPLAPSCYFDEFQCARIIGMFKRFSDCQIEQAEWGSAIAGTSKFARFSDSIFRVAFTKGFEKYTAQFGVSLEENRNTYRLRCEIRHAKGGKLVAEKERTELDRLQVDGALIYAVTTAFHGEA